jgi:uncharacterized repeat protein (TIGR01451 family)
MKEKFVIILITLACFITILGYMQPIQPTGLFYAAAPDLIVNNVSLSPIPNNTLVVESVTIGNDTITSLGNITGFFLLGKILVDNKVIGNLSIGKTAENSTVIGNINIGNAKNVQFGEISLGNPKIEGIIVPNNIYVTENPILTTENVVQRTMKPLIISQAKIRAENKVKLSKEVDHTTANVGDIVTFTIKIKYNSDNDQNTNEDLYATVKDKLPTGLDFNSGSLTQGSYYADTGLWDVGTIKEGDSATLTLKTKVTSNGAITNTAESSGHTANATVTVGGQSTPVFTSQNQIETQNLINTLNIIQNLNQIETQNQPPHIIFGNNTVFVSNPYVAKAGKFIDVTSKISNIGTATAGSFNMGFFLSYDNLITTDDILLADPTIKALNITNPESLTIIHTKVKIPFDLSPGNYFLGAIVNYNDLASESNYMNNANFDPIQLTVT